MPEKTRPQIVPLPNGPLYYFTDSESYPVAGLRDGAGRSYGAPRGIALCRCGASLNKPFCDGTHATVEFASHRTTDGAMDRRKSYVGEKITIHDNRSVCSQSGRCSEKLEAVFDPMARPWIRPDAADLAPIIAAIEGCPSGALSYSIDGVEVAPPDRPPMVTVSPNGPLEITGGIEVVGVARGQGASPEHCTLCRCGKSGNKPFCDGSHHDVEFTAP